MTLMMSTYKELVVRYDKDNPIIWIGMNPKGRQCFTLSMLVELLDLLYTLDEYGSPDPLYPDTIRYLVFQSEHPEIYNAGGDLEYFWDLVNQRNPKRLREYGTVCIDLIYWALTGGKRNITTVANVAGSALGGGFEAALACNYIIAEEQSTFAFPEPLFGFFPGMGGYDLFARFAGVTEADRAFTTGKRYSAHELDQLGVIYRLVKTGDGVEEVKKFINERNTNPISHWALQKIKQRNQSISYESLEFSIDLWVDAAMKLTERDLRMMKILTRRQKIKGSANSANHISQQQFG